MPSPVITGFYPGLPYVEAGPGADVGGTKVLPNGGRIFRVRGNGTTPTFYDDTFSKFTTTTSEELFPSIKSALLACASGRGDTILVYPGHTENLATAASWTFVDDVSIIGVGAGDNRPTMTFSAAASTLVVNKKNVYFENLRFLCAGPAGTTALTVAAPFTISGEGFSAVKCSFQIGIDADQLCTAFCGLSGQNASFVACDITSAAQTAAPTSGIILTGASGFTFVGNFCKSAFAAAGTGFIANTTTASANVRIEDNYFQQWKADSTACMTFAANSVTTGVVRRNLMRLMTDGSVAPITFGGTGVDLCFMDNFVQNAPNERGLVVGTASA